MLLTSFHTAQRGPASPPIDESLVVFHLGTQPQASNDQAGKNSSNSRKYPGAYGASPQTVGSGWEEGSRKQELNVVGGLRKVRESPERQLSPIPSFQCHLRRSRSSLNASFLTVEMSIVV